jgi:hypothetical protein
MPNIIVSVASGPGGDQLCSRAGKAGMHGSEMKTP